jgi:Mn-dependent DtxR family transcriptional regulator
MAELQIGHEVAMNHGRQRRAEIDLRAFQILGRGLADALSVPALKFCEMAEEIAEANGHQRREELAAALTLPSNDSE